MSVSGLFCAEVLENFLLLLAILLPTKSSVAYAVVLIALFGAVLSTSVADSLT